MTMAPWRKALAQRALACPALAWKSLAWKSLAWAALGRMAPAWTRTAGRGLRPAADYQAQIDGWLRPL
jgi:hypothetical protein